MFTKYDCLKNAATISFLINPLKAKENEHFHFYINSLIHGTQGELYPRVIIKTI